MQTSLRFLFTIAFIGLNFTVSAQYRPGSIGKPQYRIDSYRDQALLGSMTIELFPAIAPKHVINFDSLVKIKLFDSTAFHRVVPGFVIQGGDPNSKDKPRSTWGQGDPSQETVEAEFSKIAYLRGIIGAARSNDTNSASSQFFICVAAARNLDTKYTAYGQVVSGMKYADTIVKAPRDGNDNPIKKIGMVVTYIGMNDSVPPMPELSAPLDSAADIGTMRVFSWKTVPGAVLYTLELSESPDFNTLAFRLISGTASGKISALLPGKRYYWRVKANNGGAESAYSATRTFLTTGTSGINSRKTEEQAFFPISNKASAGELQFSYTASQEGKATFQLFNEQGQLIHQEDIHYQNGTAVYTLHPSVLTPGFYLYSFLNKELGISGKWLLF